jgi:hypothetical protein
VAIFVCGGFEYNPGLNTPLTLVLDNMVRKNDDETRSPSQQARVSFRLPVIIEGDDANGVPFTERTAVENVTRRGAFVETSRRLIAGGLLAIHDADDQEHRLGYAQVVWVRRPGNGEPGVGVRIVADNTKWMDYLITHSLQELEEEGPAEEE